MRLTTNPYVNLDDLFDFEFNYLNQHDLLGISLFLAQNPTIDSVDQIPHTHTIFKDKLNVIDFSENFTGNNTVERLSDLLTSVKIPHVILGSDPGINTNTICYFPLFYILSMTRCSRDYKSVLEHDKTYNISCLNRSTRAHRIQNYSKLIEKNYKNTLITFNDLSSVFDLESDIAKKYLKLKNEGYIPVNDIAEPTGKNVWSIHHPAYKLSYINIATETEVTDTVFLTEKTWKPIASGQLFFVVGSKGTIAYLRSLGVDVFDDIIDNSYDSEADWIVRIDRMYDSIDKLLDHDLKELYNITRDRRKQNQELFFSGKFGQQYVDKINSRFAQQGN